MQQQHKMNIKEEGRDGMVQREREKYSFKLSEKNKVKITKTLQQPTLCVLKWSVDINALRFQFQLPLPSLLLSEYWGVGGVRAAYYNYWYQLPVGREGDSTMNPPNCIRKNYSVPLRFYSKPLILKSEHHSPKPVKKILCFN